MHCEMYWRAFPDEMLIKSQLQTALEFGFRSPRWAWCSFARTGLIKLNFQPDLLLTPNNFLVPWLERDLRARTKRDVSVPAARETRKLIKKEGEKGGGEGMGKEGG